MPTDKSNDAPETIEQLDPRDVAEKLVDKYAIHEKTEVDNTDKEYEMPESGDVNDLEFEKTEHHVFKFLEFGYSLVGADAKKSVARGELVDYLTSEIESENLVLSSEITGSL